MQTKKRLKRLEQEYFSESKRHGILLPELIFCSIFAKTYEGRMDSSPEILHREGTGLSIQAKRKSP